MTEQELKQVSSSIVEAVKKGIDEKSISDVERFGRHLTEGYKEKLTTSQVRKFFGEVKRQQMIGYNRSTFVLLKPKLAYAVGRSKQDTKSSRNKIEDFYEMFAKAIDTVVSEEKNGNKEAFKNFIAIFESVVAYHKLAEKG